MSVTMEPTRRGLSLVASASSAEAGRLVQADVDGYLWIKRGGVVAYAGDLRFHLAPVVHSDHVGVHRGPIRDAIKRELAPLSKAEGRGRLLLSNDGHGNQIVELTGDTLFVASPSLLAFEPSLAHDLMFFGGSLAIPGGVLVVKLTGHGRVAISFANQATTIPVTSDAPVSVDPAALVSWAGDCWPRLKTDLDAGSIVGHGGGQPIQLLFSGDGDVTVQARRHMDLTSTLTGLLKRVI